MSSFRCKYYYYESGEWRCRKLDNTQKNDLSLSEFETYCCSESKHTDCPYYRR